MDKKPTPTEIFDAAIRQVTQQRGEVYGHPSDNFARIALIKDAVRDCPDPLVRHALEMIGVNMARLVETPYYQDGPIDIAGYARTIPMIIERSIENVAEDKAEEPDFFETLEADARFNADALGDEGSGP